MIRLIFCRTLFSQSAASVTMGSIAAVLRANGHNIEMLRLHRKDHKNGIRLTKNAEELSDSVSQAKLSGLRWK